jgi:hypothetical protein
VLASLLFKTKVEDKKQTEIMAIGPNNHIGFNYLYIKIPTLVPLETLGLIYNWMLLSEVAFKLDHSQFFLTQSFKNLLN